MITIRGVFVSADQHVEREAFVKLMKKIGNVLRKWFSILPEIAQKTFARHVVRLACPI